MRINALLNDKSDKKKKELYKFFFFFFLFFLARKELHRYVAIKRVNFLQSAEYARIIQPSIAFDILYEVPTNIASSHWQGSLKLVVNNTCEVCTGCEHSDLRQVTNTFHSLYRDQVAKETHNDHLSVYCWTEQLSATLHRAINMRIESCIIKDPPLNIQWSVWPVTRCEYVVILTVDQWTPRKDLDAKKQEKANWPPSKLNIKAHQIQPPTMIRFLQATKLSKPWCWKDHF